MAGRKKNIGHDGGPVGYGNPPVEHQFKKGGKKPVGSGRKQGSENSATIIERMLGEVVFVSISGGERPMTKREVLIRKGYEKAINSTSVRETLTLFKLFDKLSAGDGEHECTIRVESIRGDEGL